MVGEQCDVGKTSVWMIKPPEYDEYYDPELAINAQAKVFIASPSAFGARDSNFRVKSLIETRLLVATRTKVCMDLAPERSSVLTISERLTMSLFSSSSTTPQRQILVHDSQYGGSSNGLSVPSTSQVWQVPMVNNAFHGSLNNPNVRKQYQAS